MTTKNRALISPAVAAFTTVLALVAAGCMPAHLQKYRSGSAGKSASSGSTTDESLLHPGVDTPLAGTPGPATSSRPSGNSPGSARGSKATNDAGASAPRASIYAVDKQTYRFALRESDIWDAALNVLMRNYNVNIVDRTSGIITTEWDSFFLSGNVYRNKVSVRVARNNWNNIDVTVVNNVERLRDASQAAGTVGAVWLPADDPANEVARIVQNMALVLNQPPPVLPPNTPMVKGSQGDAPSSY